MGKFSAEEIEKRRVRLMAVRHLGPTARARKSKERRDQKKAQKDFVGDMASLGIFVPVEDWE